MDGIAILKNKEIKERQLANAYVITRPACLWYFQ